MNENIKPDAEQAQESSELPVIEPEKEERRKPLESFEELLKRAREGARRARLWDKNIGRETNPHNGKEYWALIDAPGEYFDGIIFKTSPRGGGTVEIDVRHPTEKDPRNPYRHLWIRTIGVNRENFPEWKIEV